MKDDLQNVQELWTALKTNGERYKPVWDDVSKFVGISVQPNYIWYNQQANAANALDQFVDDPTAAISVNQAGDYLIGIMWGTGEQVFDIIPSRYVLELADPSELDDWYDFATEQALYHMNHTEAGFHTALRPYAYDQIAFGNSGIGVFPNQDFINRTADNALNFRNYGVDNTRVDEGKSGTCDIVGTVYRWRVNRIVGEFASNNGQINAKLFMKLPKPIQDAFNTGNYNQEFGLVCLVFPRTDFNPTLKGKRGARYRGVWFMEDGNDKAIFYEESFSDKPISWARQIKVRGEVYGRSSGTLLISSIKATNYMVTTVIEILEKMSNPSLGMFNSAIFGDSVLDTSPNGLTIFNQNLAGGSPPIFPMYDVGNPEGIIKFLIPYLNDKITTAFKVDALLDLNNQTDMTATEALQRYAIRGKSLSGMLQQQKIECLEPTTKRSVSILYNIGELGVNPDTDKQRAADLSNNGKPERVIPQAVIDTIKKGRPWYELKFNNELEKLMRTQAVQNLVQILQSIIAIAGVYPDIIHAVNWYTLLKEINDNLDYNNQILMDEKSFKKTIAGIAQQRQQAMALQAGQAAGEIQKNTSTATKNNAQAGSIGIGQNGTAPTGV